MPDTPTQLQLPTTKDGRTPAGMKTKIGGAGQRISRPHDLGDRVIVVLETRVKSTGHEQTNDGVLYVEALATQDLFELEAEPGGRLLSALRQAARAAAGEHPLPGTDETVAEGIQGVVDGSGVAITPEELARLKDDPAAALEEDRLTPVVVLFDDGSRGLWPDDWEGLGQSFRGLGSVMRRPGSTKKGDVATVVELLHAQTGESLGKWTDQEEHDRLLKLEKEAEAREAAEEAQGAEETGYFVVTADGETREGLTRSQADDVAFETNGTAYFPDGDPIEVDAPAAEGEAGPFDPPDEEVEVADDGLPAEPEFHDGNDEDDELAARRAAKAAAVEEETDHLPGPDHFLFVDRKGDEVKAALAQTTDRDFVLRCMKAEEQGRGRGLVPRKGVLADLEKRAAALYSSLDSVAAPEVDAEGLAAFEPPEDAEVDAFEPADEDLEG